jgi:hypothetical protein
MEPDNSERTVRLAREDLVERADLIDGGVRALLGRLAVVGDDDAFQRAIDALMCVSRAADALRALARDDLADADDATASMAYYARRALDG